MGVPTREVNRNAKVYIAGHRGLAGSAIWRHLEASGFTNLVGRTSRELDLCDKDRVEAFMASERPDVVILAAAKVGGIMANATYPVDFIVDNLQIQLNVFEAARVHEVERLLFLGSSCIYPKLAPQPLREEYLLTGPLEPTNDAYAIAKIAGIIHVQSVRRQFGLPWISAMPTNLYGPGDNFSPTSSHVLPGLIRRYVEAVESGASEVVNWGSGAPRREFMHVDDLARGCLYLLDNYDGDSQVNLGVGRDVSIRELADKIAAVSGFTGTTTWDTSKPDGTPQKLLDVSLAESLGWHPEVDLDSGIASTVEWYLQHRDSARG